MLQLPDRAQLTLDHPNIVRARGWTRVNLLRPGGTHGGDKVFALVLDRYDSRTLSDAVFRAEVNADSEACVGLQEGVRVKAILQAIGDAAGALNYLASRGIVHGDFKADQVFLKRGSYDANGSLDVRIGDLGMAQPIGVPHSGRGCTSYAAPELAFGARVAAFRSASAAVRSPQCVRSWRRRLLRVP